MSYGYAKNIRKRVRVANDGTIFSISDFDDIAERETVRRNLSRLVDAGVLKRVLGGIYEKPKYSKLLGEYLATDINAVAEAIARNYHWTIAPSGEKALNILGLSTQVPAGWSYISDGPYKTYKLENCNLEFRHRTNKDLTGLSYMTILVIQALKTLGKEHVDKRIIQILSYNLTSSEKSMLLREGTCSAAWIYNVIKEVCEEADVYDGSSEVAS